MPIVTLVNERYELGEILGTGGMGIVYEARDLHADKTVAVKLIPKPRDERARRRFLRELETAESIRHPNVVHALDSGELPSGGLFLVMERLSGRTFESIRRQTPTIPIEECHHLLDDLLSALVGVHEAGYIHRDIKPSNVFLDKGGKKDVVKLLDFGLSKSIDDIERLTEVGTQVGTPQYMSPEQILGQAIDTRTDVFGFGATAYVMVTNHQPFGDDVPAHEMHSRALRGLITDPSAFRKDIPKDWEDLIRHALDPHPERRFRSSTELRAAWGALSLK